MKFIIIGKDQNNEQISDVVDAGTAQEAMLKCRNSFLEIYRAEKLRLKKDCEFRLKEASNRYSEWKFLGISKNGCYILKAINETLKQYEKDLKAIKKNNPSIDFGTLDEFSKIEVEQQYFTKKEITYI